MLALTLEFLSSPWFVGALFVAGLAFPLWSVIQRALCRRRLSRRDDCDLGDQINAVAAQTGMPLPDATRLWFGFARKIGLSPVKLRASDRLAEDLGGIVSDPDATLWIHPIFFSQTGTMPTRADQSPSAPTNPTLSDLLGLLRDYELKTGKCFVQEEPASSPRYRWTG